MKTSAKKHVYAIFTPAEEGGYNVSFPDYPGCVTFGQTFEEARAMAEEALELWLEELTADGQLDSPSAGHPIVAELQVRFPAQTPPRHALANR